jgi:hypothetical protein
MRSAQRAVRKAKRVSKDSSRPSHERFGVVGDLVRNEKKRSGPTLVIVELADLEDLGARIARRF